MPNTFWGTPAPDSNLQLHLPPSFCTLLSLSLLHLQPTLPLRLFTLSSSPELPPPPTPTPPSIPLFNLPTEPKRMHWTHFRSQPTTHAPVKSLVFQLQLQHQHSSDPPSFITHALCRLFSLPLVYVMSVPLSSFRPLLSFPCSPPFFTLPFHVVAFILF